MAQAACDATVVSECMAAEPNAKAIADMASGAGGEAEACDALKIMLYCANTGGCVDDAAATGGTSIKSMCEAIPAEAKCDIDCSSASSLAAFGGVAVMTAFLLN